MKRFIECDQCNDKIKEGTKIYKQSNLCGIFCSANCYVEGRGDVEEIDLDNDVVENCRIDWKVE